MTAYTPLHNPTKLFVFAPLFHKYEIGGFELNAFATINPLHPPVLSNTIKEFVRSQYRQLPSSVLARES